MTDSFNDGGITLHELRADGGAAAMDLLMQLQATNPQLPVLRSTSLEATARARRRLPVSARDCGLIGRAQCALDFERRFEPQDPLFVDLGYAAWRRALEHA